MRVRDSGMPDESYWNSFFDAECMIKKLFGIAGCKGNVVEFGCGYGTFTFPAAKHSQGAISAYDIQPELIEQLQEKSEERSLTNIQAKVRDFIADDTGLDSQSQTHAMIYNLLHLENPVGLLSEAYRVLVVGGKLSVVHWKSDIATPRGPSLEIRPTPEQCKTWIKDAGFRSIQGVDLRECCPFHFGVIAYR